MKFPFSKNYHSVTRHSMDTVRAFALRIIETFFLFSRMTVIQRENNGERERVAERYHFRWETFTFVLLLILHLVFSFFKKKRKKRKKKDIYHRYVNVQIETVLLSNNVHVIVQLNAHRHNLQRREPSGEVFAPWLWVLAHNYANYCENIRNSKILKKIL